MHAKAVPPHERDVKKKADPSVARATSSQTKCFSSVPRETGEDGKAIRRTLRVLCNTLARSGETQVQSCKECPGIRREDGDRHPTDAVRPDDDFTQNRKRRARGTAPRC